MIRSKIKFLPILFILTILLAKGSNALAQTPGIQVLEPAHNTQFAPGDPVNILVEPVGGASLSKVFVVTKFLSEIKSTGPYSFQFTIPVDAVGSFHIMVMGEDGSGSFYVATPVTFQVQPNETVQALILGDTKLYFSRLGVASGRIQVKAQYTDGAIRSIENDQLTYVSSDPAVVSIDAEGNMEALQNGTSILTVTFGGVSADVRAIVDAPPNTPPVAVVGPNQTVEAGSTVQLQGAGADQDFEPLTLNWSQTEGPAVVLDRPTEEDPTFTAPLTTGLLKFQLEVSDALFTSAPVISEVTLEDTTSPLITILGDNPIDAEIGFPYVDPWATANDLVDGNVTVSATSQLGSTPGTFEVIYSASDSSGNTANATRVVVPVDTTPPEITILGDNPINAPVGVPYVDPWATATDLADGSVPVTATSQEGATPGTFEVIYSATDAAGNTSTATRIVVVVP